MGISRSRNGAKLVKANCRRRHSSRLRTRADHLRGLAWTIADDEMEKRLLDYADVLDAEAVTKGGTGADRL